MKFNGLWISSVDSQKKEKWGVERCISHIKMWRKV